MSGCGGGLLYIVGIQAVGLTSFIRPFFVFALILLFSPLRETGLKASLSAAIVGVAFACSSNCSGSPPDRGVKTMDFILPRSAVFPAGDRSNTLRM